MSEAKRPAAGPSLFLLGAAIGTWASVCGIGGGLFAVPLLHYVYRLSLKSAVATSLTLVFASTTAATATEFTRNDSALHFPTILALVTASVIGARLGFTVARRIDVLWLKRLFVVVLLAVALKLVLTHMEPGSAMPLDSIKLDTVGWSCVLLTGLAAGFVAPLLGVGGGLVAVPALFLLVEPLGYLGARAASLMMSMFNAFVSLGLYRKTGEVRWDFARWIAPGGIVGAAFGVWVVHNPGLVVIARWLLAITLTFVAVRFSLDIRTARRERLEAQAN